jgi:hypothetical protein
MGDRRRTTIRLPVPTGPDQLHFAYSQMRWLYHATADAMGGLSSATRRAVHTQAVDALTMLLPEAFPTLNLVEPIQLVP